MEDRLEHEAFFVMLCKVLKFFGTCNIVEELAAWQCFPMKAGWAIAAWLPEDWWVGGIPVPDFTALFNLQKHCKYCLTPSSLFVCLRLFTC